MTAGVIIFPGREELAKYLTDELSKNPMTYFTPENRTTFLNTVTEIACTFLANLTTSASERSLRGQAEVLTFEIRDRLNSMVNSSFNSEIEITHFWNCMTDCFEECLKAYPAGRT